ncbi:hypothetical protein EMPS_04782 [Entomortierella parvispora]|uniref:LysM domain-containing protein n=1 Tax=Entomortierella parvispora TaxID=205924 RepID=A0A9P3H9F7_9FUNG|nr:hypothetical protein EMPS_04782 [Entomortierella parvispora]
MKITLSLAVLALAASQAMAVVPKPIAGCTKEVVVLPTDTGCADFAAKNGCTFEDLLKWNLKLRTDCANLDVGAPLCVSVTPGAGGKPTEPSSPVVNPPVVPSGTAHPVVPTGTVHPVPKTSATKAGTVPVATTTSAAGAAATLPPTAARVNGAAADKASMVLSVAGVLISAAYML